MVAEVVLPVERVLVPWAAPVVTQEALLLVVGQMLHLVVPVEVGRAGEGFLFAPGGQAGVAFFCFGRAGRLSGGGSKGKGLFVNKKK